MKRTALKRWIPFRLAALVAPLIAAWPQQAQAETWVPTAAGTTYDWGATANWSPATVPNSATAIANIINNIAGAQTINLNANRTVNDLNLGDSDGSHSFTIAPGVAGSLLIFGGTAPTMDITGNAANTISAGIRADANVIFRSTSTGLTTISAAMTNNGTARSMTFNNDVNGTVNAAATNQGQFSLTVANTLGGTTGTTAISDVRVNGSVAGAFGANAANSVTMTGAGQAYLSGGTHVNNFILNSTGWVETAGNFGALRVDNSTVSGTVAMQQNSIISSQSAQGNISGVISGGFNLTKSGASILNISAANSYTGTTTVNDGTLQIRNNGSLGNATSTVIVTNGGAPGSADVNQLMLTGGLTVNRNLLLENTGTANSRSYLTSNSALNGNANTWSGSVTFKGGSNQALEATNAPLIMTGAINNDGTTPSTSVFFRGANTGTFSATATVNLGSAAFLKTDGGTWIANNTTSMVVGSTLVADGTLSVGANNALSTTAPLTLGQGSGTNGTLNIASGISQTLSSVTVASGSTGTQRITGPGSLDTGAVNRTYLVNDSAGIPQDLIISAPITGSGGFSKTGAGTLALNSAVTGPVTVSAGRLEGTGSYNGGLTIDAGTILSPGSDLLSGNISSAGFTALAGASTINLNVGSAGEWIANTGGITALGTTTINLNGAGSLPNSGNLNLITHDGSFSGTAGFLLGTLPGRVIGNLVNTGNTPGSAIALNITGNDKVIWTGATDAAWDINTTQNWKLQSNSNPTGFLQGDDLIFDNSGANTTITLGTAANPSRADFQNTGATSYTITGAGGLGGSMILDKTGSGSVTLAPVQAPAALGSAAHTYVGQTNVGSGALTLNYTGLTGTNAPSATVLSSVTPVDVASGATLNIVRDNQQTNFANNLSGSGTLVVDITNGGTAGARSFLFSGNNSGFSGSIKLSPTGGGTSGTLRTLNAAANGGAPASAFGTASIEVDPGAQFWGATGTYNNNLTIAGAGYAEGGGGSVPDTDLTALGYANYAGTGAIRIENGSTLAGSITLDGAAKIQVINNAGGTNAGTATISGNITNTAGQVLVVGGASTNAVHSLILTGDNSGLEQIWVNSSGAGGTSAFDLLQIGNGGTTGTLGSGNVILHGDAARGAILRIARSDGYTLAPGQQILGDVTGTTVADLARTRLDLNVTGTGFDNAGNTIDLRDTGVNGGDILVGNTVAGAVARLTGTVEARNLQVGVFNAALPTGNAVLHLGKADGSAATTVNVNAISVATGGSSTPVGNTNNSTININPGVTMNVSADFHLGEQPNSAATVNQLGGDVTVGGHMRIGHWGSETSNYNISGGTLTYNGANPATTPSGTGEATTGGLYLGVDGTGNLTQSGSSVINTNFIVLDNRGAAAANATPGTDTLSLNGGTLNLTGNWGIIARHPLSSLVSLNGGTVANSAASGTAVMIDAPVAVGSSGGTLSTSANATSSLVLTSNVTGAGNSVSLTGSGKLTFNPNSKTVLDGTSDGLGNQLISANLNGGTVPVEKIGTGTTTLAGTNTYGGTTTVTAGRLNLTGSIANSDLTAASGSTLSGEGSAKTIALSGGGNLLIDGTSTGALTSIGALTASGVTNVDFSAPPATSVVTVLNHGGTTATPANFALVNAANYRASNFTVNAGDVTLDTGRKNLTWAGTTGTWEIAGADVDWNTGADNFFYGDAITFNDSNGTNSTVALTGTLVPSGVTVNSNTNQFVLNGSAGNLIGGTGSLLKDGTSTLTVNAPNTYTGGTVISEGEFFSRTAAAAGTGGVTLGDANTATATDAPAFIADVNGAAASLTITNPLTVAASTGPVAIIGSTASTPVGALQANFDGTLSLNDDVKFLTGAGDFTRFRGAISGPGNIDVVNGSLTGDLRGNGGNRVILNSNANAWTGNLTVKAGTATNYTVFQTDVADIINNNSGVTVEDNAVFRLNANEGIDGLTGSSGARVRGVVGARTLTVGLNNASSTFAGTLENDPFDAGSLALTKSGTGTLILSGTNTNTGATTVSGGTLQVGSGGATGQLGSGAVSLAAGTALNFNRTGLATQSGAINSAATGTGTLNVNGDNTTAVVLAAGGTFSGVVNVNGGALVAGATNPWNTHLTAPTFNIAAGAALAAGPASAHAHIGALNLSGGTVSTAPGGTGSYDGENFQLNGNVTVTGTVPSTITRDPARTNADSGISLRGIRTFDVGDVTGSASVDLFVSTELENTDAATVTAAGPGGIIKTGLGTMSLSGVHSYTGPTTVNAGILRLETGSSITASSLLTVNNGSAVTGNGSTGPMVLAAGSTISPGSSPGLLTTGTVTVSATTSVIMEIGGLTPITQFDQVSTSGALNLDGGLLTVSLIGGYIPNAYDAFDIWLNDGADVIGGTAGTFSGLPEGTQISIPTTTGGLGGGLDSDYWIISYFGGTGNDIRLTYVPEPSSAMLAGAFGLLALGRRRRKA